MARNNNKMTRRKSKKVEPAVQHMYFGFTAPAGAFGSNKVTQFIDLSQCASLMNRRFYRQGLVWCVSDIKVTTTSTSFGATPTGSISVQKLPTTWVMGNAWEKSFRVWQRMIDNATDESGAQSIKGKFLDFKIYADSDHHSAGFAANLMPFSLGGLYSPGQWQPSEIEIPVQNALTDTREFVAVGPNDPGVSPASGYDAVSVIQGYADSRALPSTADPNVPADANDNWMVKLFDNVSDQDQDVIADLEVMGNNPPYPFEGDQAGTPDTMYPGGETQAPVLEFHDESLITGTTIGATTHLNGGLFPCGLIKVQCENYDSENGVNFLLRLQLVPGDHRGYLCESMTEM